MVQKREGHMPKAPRLAPKGPAQGPTDTCCWKGPGGCSQLTSSAELTAQLLCRSQGEGCSDAGQAKRENQLKTDTL